MLFVRFLFIVSEKLFVVNWENLSSKKTNLHLITRISKKCHVLRGDTYRTSMRSFLKNFLHKQYANVPMMTTRDKHV